MKIALIGPAHPYRGGIASYNERLAREFQLNGDQVELITFSLQYPDFLFPGTSQFTSSPKPDDLSIQRRINSINPLNWLAAGLSLRKKKFDLIIVRYWLPLLGPALGSVCKLAKAKNTTVICLADNIIPHEKRPGDRLFTWYFNTAVQGYLTMTQEVSEQVRQFTVKKPVKLSPHPINDTFGAITTKEEARTKLGIPTNQKYLLFFGFIRDYKGLDLLLKALAQTSVSDLNLLVAGEFYKDREEYDELIKQLNLQDRVRLFADFIPDKDVHLYFNAADVVVQPYKTATQSGVTQIAYHFNKPMIVTKVGGLPEMCPDGKVGYCVEPDPKKLAKAIDAFYQESKEDFFIKGVKEEKQRFSWSVLVTALKELKEEING